MKMLVIRPRTKDFIENTRLSEALDFALRGVDCETVYTTEQLRHTDKTGRRLLFAVSLGETGVNLEYYAVLKYIRENSTCFQGCVGGILVDGKSELYTKSLSRELALSANLSGCAFVGQPLVEGTVALDNFTIIAKNMGTDNHDAYLHCAAALIKRIEEHRFNGSEKPNILVLHASSHETSNTFALWGKVKKQLGGSFDITEIGLRNGTLSDCSGCPYTACLHFGEHGGCFYGGVMVNEVYPAILKANALVMLCPNYNDALSANLTACINRLTALFRANRFYEKALFGIVVSGYSGSDIVAGQLIAALNMNKTFFLPPRFCMMQTANNAGSALRLPHIDEQTCDFAENMKRVLLQNNTEEKN